MSTSTLKRWAWLDLVSAVFLYFYHFSPQTRVIIPDLYFAFFDILRRQWECELAPQSYAYADDQVATTKQQEQPPVSYLP